MIVSVFLTLPVERSIFHAVGTAAISERGALWGVLDPDLRVKGTKGLRVVDASALPYVPSAHSEFSLMGERPWLDCREWHKDRCISWQRLLLKKSRRDATRAEARVLISCIKKTYLNALVLDIPSVLRTSTSWGTEMMPPGSIQKSFDLNTQGTVPNM